jgi:hypothetical protein
MPVLGEVVAHPVVAAIAAALAAQDPSAADPCQAPRPGTVIVRLESASAAALPGPDSPACRAAKEKAARRPAQPPPEPAKSRGP